MNEKIVSFTYQKRGSIVSTSFQSGSARIAGLTGAISPILIRLEDQKTSRLLLYRVYALYFSFNSSIKVYRETAEKWYKRAEEDKFVKELYYNNNGIGDDNIALKVSLANIINTTAELYETLRFCLGSKPYSNLSTFLKKTPEYTGGLRDNMIKQEWDNIKHQFDLSVDPIIFNATQKAIIDPEVKGMRKIKDMKVNDFYHYVLDDFYKTIDEIVKEQGV
ncbi:MAG: hypothetical protein WAQ27_04605 [Candidatus Microsaccharimonas sp.]